jgi:hypothetical protein
MESEKNHRKAKQEESDKLDFEKRLEEMAQKYSTVKAELDATLKELEGL